MAVLLGIEVDLNSNHKFMRIKKSPQPSHKEIIFP